MIHVSNIIKLVNGGPKPTHMNGISSLCGLFIMMWYDRTGELWFDLIMIYVWVNLAWFAAIALFENIASKIPQLIIVLKLAFSVHVWDKEKKSALKTSCPRSGSSSGEAHKAPWGFPWSRHRPRVCRKWRSRWRKLKFHSQSQDRTDQILHRISWSRGHCKWVEDILPHILLIFFT